MTFRLLIEKSSQKELSKIHPADQNKIIEAIRNLADTPKPSSVKKLSGRDAWRIRVGSYRIIYEIDYQNASILIVNIGHRKDIYR